MIINGLSCARVQPSSFGWRCCQEFCPWSRLLVHVAECQWVHTGFVFLWFACSKPNIIFMLKEKKQRKNHPAGNSASQTGSYLLTRLKEKHVREDAAANRNSAHFLWLFFVELEGVSVILSSRWFVRMSSLNVPPLHASKCKKFLLSLIKLTA